MTVCAIAELDVTELLSYGHRHTHTQTHTHTDTHRRTFSHTGLLGGRRHRECGALLTPCCTDVSLLRASQPVSVCCCCLLFVQRELRLCERLGSALGDCARFCFITMPQFIFLVVTQIVFLSTQGCYACPTCGLQARVPWFL